MLGGKKATIMLIFLVFIGITVTLTVFFINSQKTSTRVYGFGQAQLQIVETYQKGEKALTFIDLTAKLAMQQSAFDLANSMKTDCGSYDGYPLWYSDGKECYPTTATINSNYLARVNGVMNDYFEKYGGLTIPKDNYDYAISNSNGKLEIVGVAKKPLVVEVKNEAP